MLENEPSYIKTLAKLGLFLLSLLFSLPGALLAWLGFIAPGWLWSLNFSTTEGFWFILFSVAGFVGLSLWAIGLFALSMILKID